MTQATRLYTAEEFEHLPDPPHGGKMELVRGEVVTHMPVGGPHAELAGAIQAMLYIHVRRTRIGVSGVECGFVLDREPDLVRAPDVHFVRSERLTGGHMPRGFFHGPPDLAVEVVSPDDTDAEVQQKVREYLLAGALRVWVVRPEAREVTVHRPGGDAHSFGIDETLTSAEAGFDEPGFSLLLSELFAR